MYRRSICSGRIDRFNLVKKVTGLHQSSTAPRLCFSAWEILARSKNADRKKAAAPAQEDPFGSVRQSHESRSNRTS
jgi:hypothetical protein